MSPPLPKVLLVHDRYQAHGGEDVVFEQERRLLERAGHEVVTYERDNREIATYGLLGKASLVVRTTWAWDARADLERRIDAERPDVAHFTNTFPLISPAAYGACRARGVAVVQSLHNYRLFCPAGTFYRAGRPCEACLDGGPFHGVRHRCYRDSAAQTAVVATMIATHRRLGTFARDVDRYVVLTEVMRRLAVRGGLPADRLVVKPNFLADDPGPRSEAGSDAVFLGRLSAEKGILTLLDAWAQLRDPPPLSILGDGPLRDEVERRAAQLTGVQVRGAVPRPEALLALRRAKFLVFPSRWYEGFPMTLLEAFASGVPVIAARVGGAEEMVAAAAAGRLYPPERADALAAEVRWAEAHPDALAAHGLAGRRAFEAGFTADRNLAQLRAIYAAAQGELAAQTRSKRAPRR